MDYYRLNAADLDRWLTTPPDAYGSEADRDSACIPFEDWLAALDVLIATHGGTRDGLDPRASYVFYDTPEECYADACYGDMRRPVDFDPADDLPF